MGCASAADNQTADDVALESDAVTDEILTDGAGDFTELKDAIARAENEFKLEKNYTYNPATDDEDIKYYGVKVSNGNLVIDGQGHTMDGQGQSRMFSVYASNIVIKNVNFINGYAELVSAGINCQDSAFNITIDNCNFTNMDGNDGGAVRIYQNAIIKNCNFINTSARYEDGGAISFHSLNKLVTVYNCNFTNASCARQGGAIISMGYSIIDRCNFYNCEEISTTGSYNGGGAIYLWSGYASTLTNSNFYNIKSGRDGGAVYSAHNLTVVNCSFINASCQGKGGAIYLENHGTIENCNFTDNRGLYGSAVYANHNATFKNCNFERNNATQAGTVFINDMVAMENCSFRNNYGFVAGAIDLINGKGTVKNSTFANNRAVAGGAAIYTVAFELTLENCNFYKNLISIESSGAALYAEGKSTVKNCNFTDNKVGNNGGAIAAYDAITVIGSNFNNNSASKNGGAIYLGANGTIEECNFTNNTANRFGGAIYNTNPVFIRNSNFNNNPAGSNGGAICFANNGTIENSNFTNNSGYEGGAIYLETYTIFIKNSNFNNNTARRNEGGAVNVMNSGTVIIDKCTFTNNTAVSNGGAVKLIYGNVTNSVFTNNTGESSGALYISEYGVVKNCTFAGNIAKGFGGAAEVSYGNIANCIFNNNNVGAYGAALDIYNCTVVNCSFNNNKVNISEGGAICASKSIIRNCTFTNNTSPNGGAICGAQNRIENSTFINNTSPNGGAICGAQNRIENSTFINNTAGIGGAIYVKTNGTVINCIFENNNASDKGGAIYSKCPVTVENCIFTNNKVTSGSGGAIYFYDTGTVKNCNFTNNKATADNGWGGAVYFEEDGTVTNCNFTNNAAYHGGAVYFYDAGNVTNCNFTHNEATYHGGAIYFYLNGNVTNCNFTNNKATHEGGAIWFATNGNVTNCNFANNKATADDGWGGAICMYFGTVTNCNFTNNKATSGSGGAVYFYDTGTVKNCNFTNNTASDYGGAIRTYYGSVENCNFTNNSAMYGGAIGFNGEGTVTNCNFANNNASEGGAIYSSCPVTVEDCKFKNNNATDAGGAIYIEYSGEDYNKDALVKNSRFDNNTAKIGGAFYMGYGGLLSHMSYGHIENCNFTGNFVTEHGGAVYLSSNVTVAGSNFNTNTAQGFGGAIYVTSCSDIQSSNFTGNHAGDDGGALYFSATYNYALEVKESTFTANSAGSNGGAIYSYGGTLVSIGNGYTKNNASKGGAIYAKKYLTLNNDIYNANTAQNGGAVYSLSPVTVDECRFTNNNATGGSGGAIYIYYNKPGYSTDAVVKNSQFDNNAAANGGALYMDWDHSASDLINIRVENCNFTNNTAISFTYYDGVGAAVYIPNGTIINSNFDNNSADRGAGAVFVTVVANIESCNFTNNHAGGRGGAIVFDYVFSRTSALKEINFVSNTANDGGAIYAIGSITVDSSNFTDNKADNCGGAICGLNDYPIEISNSIFKNNKAKAANISQTENPTGDVPLISLTFNGNERWINAIYYSQVTLSNVTYWNGAMVNTDNAAPILDGCPGINITVEIYDSANNLVDNVTLVTNSSGQFVYNPVKFNGGDYVLRAYHVEDDYYTQVNSEDIPFTVIKNSTSVKINIPDNANFTYGNCNISFEVINRTEVRVVITDKTGAVLLNETTDKNYVIADFALGDYNITVYNKGTDTYSSSMDSKLFSIIKANSKVVIGTIGDVVYGNDANVEITGENLTSVNVTVYDRDGEVVFTKVIEDSSVKVSGLVVGQYRVVAVNLGSDLINESSDSKTFNVVKANSTVIVSPIGDVVYGDDVSVEISGENLTSVNVTVYGKDDVVVFTKVIEGSSVKVSGLVVGQYRVVAVNLGSDLYNESSDSKAFNVFKANSTVIVSPIGDVVYGDDVSVEISGENLTSVNVTVYGKDGAVVFSKIIEDSKVKVSGLVVGQYRVVAVNLGSDLYNESSDSKSFNVFKANSTVIVSPIGDVVYGSDVSVEISGENLTSVNVTVYGKDDVVVFTKVIEGSSVKVSGLVVGQYRVVAVNLGSDLYNESSDSKSFNVFKAKNNVVVSADNAVLGNNVTVRIAADVDGIYTIDVNGTVKNVTVSGGKGSLSLYLDSGSYYANATFDNPNYDSNIINATFAVFELIIEANGAKYGLNDNYVYQAKLVDGKGNPVSNRTLNFTIGGNTFNATTDADGVAKITFTAEVGTYDMTISNNRADTVTAKVEILPRIVETKDLVMDYDTGSFRVRALGDDGNPIANEVVRMIVNGVTYNVKTDKDGYATLPIELKPKTYAVTSTYKGTTVKNTIKVKSTLKAKKTLKIKKTAKKLILKATLKWSNGKAIAGKKIIIKFKGKKYKVKTNRKGIAKKVLTKKTIKKLKKGKTYKAKFSYKNETAFTKVKVRK